MKYSIRNNYNFSKIMLIIKSNDCDPENTIYTPDCTNQNKLFV